MSADNYYVVRRHPSGGWTYVMAFTSDEDPDLTVSPFDAKFSSPGEALMSAMSQYAEYGVEIHPECREDFL